MKALNFQRAFDRKHLSELRRRLVRGALRRSLGADGAAAALAHGIDAAAIHRVLICRPNHRLGNLLLLTPLLAELESSLPDATVDIVLAGNDGPELFRGFPNVRHVYCLARRVVRHPFATSRVALQIRRAHYDLVIDPCEASQSSRLLGTLARPEHLLGLPRDGATAPAWVDGAPVHMGQWPVFLLRGALQKSVQQHRFAFPPLDLRLSDDERQRGRETLAPLFPGHAPTRKALGVFVEATGAKRLSLDWWRRFLREVRELQATLAIIEIVPVDGCPRLARECPGFGSPSPRKVAAVIANLAGCVSADCGVMHLASAAGVPTFGLFAASDLARYAPYGHGSQGILVNGKRPEEVARTVSLWIDACGPGHAPSGPASANGRRNRQRKDNFIDATVTRPCELKAHP